MGQPGSVSIRFYEELNDFLPPALRKINFQHNFRQRGSVKDLIESLGVPHTEIDLIMVNGESVDFNYQVCDGDRISVYPVFETLDITPLTHLRPVPLRDIRFVLDTHLGRLAAYLRMLGFDSLYQNDYDDTTLARISANQHRILLTCDKGLLMRKQVSQGYFVRARQPREQLTEIVNRFDLKMLIQPFTRCMDCNGNIHPVTRDAIKSGLPPDTGQYYDEFWQCQSCKKIYWKGTHYQRMLHIIEEIMTGTTVNGS
jgi:uncharacterized protein with PIN domain